jgi:class 3 adenylate cyclase
VRRLRGAEGARKLRALSERARYACGKGGGGRLAAHHPQGDSLANLVATIRDALDGGRNTEALDLARAAVADAPSSAEIHYLGGLASARMGAIAEAEQWLAAIDRDALGYTPLATEVWGLAGRIAKERYAAARWRAPGTASDFARLAIEGYRRAFELSGSAYPAVNAATMAMLSGDPALADRLARQALAAMEPIGDHWHHACSGEARLLLGDVAAARADYTEAHRLAGTRHGDVATMRRQLRLIGSPASLALLDVVPAPCVIAFSGHMIDRAERKSPRFPASLEAPLAAALRETLARLGPSIGYAQAACGADLLFLEAMQDAGMATHIVLPFAPADYVRTSVAFAGDPWIARFGRALGRATSVTLATEEAFLGDDVLFEHASNLIQGMALLRAKELAAQPLMLTVYDRGSRELAGGTAATVRAWSRQSGRLENIDLALLRTGDASAPSDATEDAPPPHGQTSGTGRSLKSLLFADITGFSRLPEQYTPRFVEVFLGTSKAILDSLRHPAVDAHTLGDGLFLVFERPSHAAEFAVRLQKALGLVDWPAMGMARETAARIGLHTGPVLRTYDPIMRKPAYYGTHVNRTARLEPIVRPGHIFTTEAFAASLGAERDDRFDCNYIGAMSLAKQFGEARLYRLRSHED